MRPVDLTHPFSIHTPGWVDYPSPKLSYFQRFATNGIVSQLLETPLHCGHALRQRDAHHLRRRRRGLDPDRSALP